MSAENGRLPWSQLVYVGKAYDGSQAFLGDLTAPAWLAMQAACLAETGVLLVISPNGGYRDLPHQEDELDNGGAPVGESTHGEREGSVDIWNWEAAWPWLLTRADDFGWVRDVGGENWHHHKVYAFAAAAGTPGTAPTITRTRSKEDSMKRIAYCTDIRNVGGRTDDQGAWVIYGPPTHDGAPLIQVTHSEGIRNRLLKGRGYDVMSEADRNEGAPQLTFAELTTVLLFEVGFDTTKVGEGSTANQPGGLMIDGFAWPVG